MLAMEKAEAAREQAFVNMVEVIQSLAERVKHLEHRVAELEDARPSMGP